MSSNFKTLKTTSNYRYCKQLSIAGLSSILTSLTINDLNAAVLPSTSNLQFQTSGPNRCANIGDWYSTDGTGVTPNCNTNSTNTDRVHRFNIDITQEMLDAQGGIVNITIIDAESSPGGSDIDEIGSGVSDPTRFQLYDSTGLLLDSQSTVSGTPNGTNLVFSINSPGTYQITSETGARRINSNSAVELNDDDNSFRISIPDAGSSPELKSLIGQFQGTMQQNSGGNLSFETYFILGPGPNNLEIRNFDVDNRATFVYRNSSGISVGSPTTSGNGLWNNGGNLNTGGDNLSIDNAAPTFDDTGTWNLSVNSLSNNNQFILEANTGNGDRLVVYDSPPVRAGNFTITPDTIETVRNAQSVDHPFTVTNLFNTTDIINLNLSGTDPNYTTQLIDASTNQPLTDLDQDGNLDTGILDPNQSLELILRVTHNGLLGDGGNSPDDITTVSGVSFLDTKVDPANNITRTVDKTTLFDSLAVAPTPNPEYTKGCGTGIKIALILDASGSIDTNAGDQEVRNGIKAFIDEIATIAPGTEIGIVEFGLTADTPVPYTVVNPTNNTAFDEYININQNLNGSQKRYDDGRVLNNTNWESAFRTVNLRVGDDLNPAFANFDNPNYPIVFERILPAEVNPLLTQADAVIFVTDGNPNVIINDDGNLRSAGAELGVNETVPWTDIIKQGGTHIYGFGIAAPGTDIDVLNFARLTDGASTTEYDLDLDNAESADYAFVNQFADFGDGLIDLANGVCGKRPNLSLVKRITAINRGQFSNERSFDDYYVDVTPTDDFNNAPSDNLERWPGALTIPNEGVDEVKSYLQGKVFDLVVPDDEIEYTIYFLSNGNQTAESVLICDLIPENTVFVEDSFSPRTNNPRASSLDGLPGARRGLLLELNNEFKSLTSGKDGDAGYYFPPNVDPAATFPGIKCGDHTTKPNEDPNLPNVANNHGAVVIDLNDLPFATAPGVPKNSYGSIRFRVNVK